MLLSCEEHETKSLKQMVILKFELLLISFANLQILACARALKRINKYTMVGRKIEKLLKIYSFAGGLYFLIP